MKLPDWQFWPVWPPTAPCLSLENMSQWRAATTSCSPYREYKDMSSFKTISLYILCLSSFQKSEVETQLKVQMDYEVCQHDATVWNHVGEMPINWDVVFNGKLCFCNQRKCHVWWQEWLYSPQQWNTASLINPHTTQLICQPHAAQAHQVCWDTTTLNAVWMLTVKKQVLPLVSLLY